MRNFIKGLFIGLVGVIFVGSVVYAITPPLPTQQGGTGINSATTTNIGSVLTVSSSNPFVYKLAPITLPTSTTFTSLTTTNLGITGITSSSVLFTGANGIVQGNSTSLSFDGSNFGVGTNSALYPLTVSGTAYISGSSTIAGKLNLGQLSFSAATGTNMSLSGQTKLSAITYVGAQDSFKADTNLALQIIGTNTGLGISRTANSYGAFIAPYNATTYGVRVIEASNDLALVVSSATQALTVKSTGNVGVGTTSPQALLTVGSQGGSIVDGNTPLQMSTGGAGTQVNFGLNKDGAYGFLFGYLNSAALGGYNPYVGSYFRNVAADPFAIVMNSANIASLWNSNSDIAFGSNISSSSTYAGANVIFKSTGETGFGTTTPQSKAQVVIQATSTLPALTIASSTGLIMANINKTGNLYINVPNGAPTNPAKLVVRGDGGDIYAIENAAGVRQLTLAESGAATYSGTIRINGGQIINGSASDGILYTLNAGTSWLSIANASTSVAFGIAGPNGGGQNTDFFQIRSSWTGPKVGDVWAVDKSGNLGIGTSTPRGRLTVDSIGGATTTVWFNSTSTVKGTCLVMKDSGGTGLTFITTFNGIFTASTVDCR